MNSLHRFNEMQSFYDANENTKALELIRNFHHDMIRSKFHETFLMTNATLIN